MSCMVLIPKNGPACSPAMPPISFALIELKLILDQRKKIDDFENTLECVENLFQELQIRDDIPTDIKHKIDSLSNNKSERGD